MKTERLVEKNDTIGVAPLISIIVPIYNVERYVRKCLDSLVQQTLKEIEVICIDDGSVDGSGRIADEYENRYWPIFHVIHTENRDLSAARNRGLEEAKAEWIMFVDSDDWVHIDFCRIPYEAALENQADMVIFGFYEVNNGKHDPQFRNAPFGLIDEFVANEFGGSVAWRRLYRKELFTSIKYPEGHVYEDIATTYRLTHNAERIFFLKDYLYFHLYREGSISNTRTASNKKDYSAAKLGKCLDLMTYGIPEIKLKTTLYSAAMSYLTCHDFSDDYFYRKATEIANEISGIPKFFSFRQKVALALWKIHPRLFRMVCRIKEGLNATKIVSNYM